MMRTVVQRAFRTACSGRGCSAATYWQPQGDKITHLYFNIHHYTQITYDELGQYSSVPMLPTSSLWYYQHILYIHPGPNGTWALFLIN
jgi:hypothetical protein